MQAAVCSESPTHPNNIPTCLLRDCLPKKSHNWLHFPQDTDGLDLRFMSGAFLNTAYWSWVRSVFCFKCWVPQSLKKNSLTCELTLQHSTWIDVSGMLCRERPDIATKFRRSFGGIARSKWKSPCVSGTEQTPWRPAPCSHRADGQGPSCTLHQDTELSEHQRLPPPHTPVFLTENWHG